MKQHGHTLIGLQLFSFVLACCVCAGQADISLTLRNGGGRGGQPYLPPPVQELPIDEVINRAITEEIVQQEQQQQQFHESNFGDSRYHIFEVHNHFGPGQSSFKGPDYLPPVESNQLVEAASAVSLPEPAPTNIPIPFPSNYRHDFQQEAQQEAEADGAQASGGGIVEGGNFKGPDYLPPLGAAELAGAENAGGFQGPDYLPPHKESAASNQHANGAGGFSGPDYLPPHAAEASVQGQGVLSQPIPTTGSFKGPDYLPPHALQGHAEQGGAFKGPDYLPPHAQTHAAQLSQPIAPTQGTFKGPDYLPPTQGTFKGPDYLPPVSQSQGHAELSGAFKGPDYLPPHAQGQQAHQGHDEQSDAFRGPDYLPPHNQQQGHAEQSGAFKGPDYLPPQPQTHESQLSQQIASTPQTFKGPDYLPPTQGTFKGPDYLPPHGEQSLSQPIAPTQATQAFKGPDYLPPHAASTHAAQLSQPFPTETAAAAAFKGPDYLPPHANEQLLSAPLSTAATATSTYQGPDYLPPTSATYSAPDYLPPHSHGAAGQSETLADTLGVSRPAQAAQNLPTGYDFVKPPNSEAAIAELHSLQLAQQQQQQQQQQREGRSQSFVVQAQLGVHRDIASDIVYGQPKLEARSNGGGIGGGGGGGNAYLPPAPAAHVQGGHAQASAPIAAAPRPAYRGPAYLPPAPASSVAPASIGSAVASSQQHQQHLHSLSSYMSAVQPYARYGAAQYAEPRRPFAKYGPPPSAPVHVAQETAGIAPMYRAQAANRPQHYAPAMSYASNAVAQAYTTYTTHAARQPQAQAVHVPQPQPRPQPQPQPQHTQSRPHAQPQAPHRQQTTSYALSAQSKHALQSFMPKEVQRQIAALTGSTTAVVPRPFTAPAAVAAAAATSAVSSGKIRTVQIINPHQVRTLKVLETSDYSGVKTIKILGHSRETPTGEHRVVKVVSQSGHDGKDNHVQTVKIFNDQKDVTVTANAVGAATAAATAAVAAPAVATAPSSAYLPAARTRLSRKRSVRVARESVLRRHHNHYEHHEHHNDHHHHHQQHELDREQQ